MNAPDVIVIGSGPAGVSVAWPLVTAGVRVLMIDAANLPPYLPAPDRPPLFALHRHPSAWTHFLGKDLFALRQLAGGSPKLRTAGGPGFGDDYRQLNRIRTRNFDAVGALSEGGLSNVWGAVACAFRNEDFSGYPIDLVDLERSYRSIAERIGISGTEDDAMGVFQGTGMPLQPPLPLSPCATRMIAAFGTHDESSDFLLGRPRHAVLSAPIGDRQACTLDRACMWGCARGAIYNSADEVSRLRRQETFAHQGGLLVQSIRRRENTYTIHAREVSSGNEAILKAPLVVLAAGTLPSTRLVLEHAGKTDMPLPLLTAPAMALALWLPALLGRALPGEGYGLAQLCFRKRLPNSPPGADYTFGLLYDAGTMPASDLLSRLAVSRRGGIALLRRLLSSLMVGLVYFPSTYSRNRIWLEKSGDIMIEGGVSSDFAKVMGQTTRNLARSFCKLGAIVLPGSVKPFTPGAEVHYAGTLPMGALTSRYGEVEGAPNLFVADGSVLNALPARHHTLTIMANADRIGRSIVYRLQRRHELCS